MKTIRTRYSRFESVKFTPYVMQQLSRRHSASTAFLSAKCHHEDVLGSGCRAPCILNLDIIPR